ncbi:Ig-like domain-containing protein [Siccirubricoccus deserti]
MVGNAGGQTADLRGLFFHLNNFAAFTGLTVTGDPAVVTDRQIANNGVIDLGNGANMQGEASPFDIGVEFGRQGIGQGDDIKTATFILSADQTLSLNDIELAQFGARLTSVGTQGGSRQDSLKLVGNAPEVNYPPDAVDDHAAVRADATKTIDVLANDTDLDGDPLTVTSIAGLDPVTEGTAQIVGNQVVFDPAPAFASLLAGDTIDVAFSYTAQDPGGLTDTADVTVQIVGVNEGTQTDTTNGTLQNGQSASISLTTELRTIDDKTDISGTINIGNLATQKFNVTYIIDVSGSTSAQSAARLWATKTTMASATPFSTLRSPVFEH